MGQLFLVTLSGWSGFPPVTSSCMCRYTGAVCEACASGWIMSNGRCIPYTPLLYTLMLWTKFLSTVKAPAPAPAAAPGAGWGRPLNGALAPGPAPSTGPASAAEGGKDSALGPALSAGAAGRGADTESAQAVTPAGDLKRKQLTKCPLVSEQTALPWLLLSSAARRLS